MDAASRTAPEPVPVASGQIPSCGIDVESIRQDFPALHQEIHGKPLVYLDNAATTQRPRQVIETVSGFYERDNSNVHRGVHTLSERATEEFESTREKVRRFIGAGHTREIIFVRGTTEAINLVASSYGREHVGEGDEVLVSAMEHHSNIVPWQMLCEAAGAKLRVIPMNDDGELLLDEFERLLSERVKIVAVNHISNALGTINPVGEIVRLAHAHGAVVVVDGAQATPHVKVDVRGLDADFYAMSAHKMYGPTGVGVLWGREELLEPMPPYQGGGDMIKSVTFEKTLYNSLPHRFEAGTPNVAGVIGLGAAIDYLERVCLKNIAAHERDLLEYGTERLSEIEGLRLIGTARAKAAVVSFVLEGVHPHDIGTIIDHEGVAIRTGHHCAQPAMQRFGVPATARASLGLYNTRAEIDALVQGIGRVKEVFG